MSDHSSDLQNKNNSIAELADQPKEVQEERSQQAPTDDGRKNLALGDWWKSSGNWSLRAFMLATAVYFLISFLQAFQQWLYTPGYNITALQIEQSAITLCARYPAWLASDGMYQRGILSLWMLPPLSTASLLTNTNVISVSPTVSNTTGVVTPTVITAVPTSSKATPNTLRCRLVIQEVYGEASPVIDTTTVVTSVTQPISMTLGLSIPFVLGTSPGLRFVNSQDVMYSPIVNVGYDNEVSVKIEHAGLLQKIASGSFQIIQATTGKVAEPDSFGISMGLEGSGGMLWRKFWEIVLSPTTGALVALAAVTVDELRKQEERKQKRKESEDKFRSACQEVTRQLREPKHASIPTILQNWLEEIDRIPAELKTLPVVKEEMSKTVSMAIEQFVAYAKHDLKVFFEPKSSWSEILVTLQKFEEQNKSLSDLDFLCSTEKHDKEYQFIDPFFAGYYLNLYWIKKDKQEFLIQQVTNFTRTFDDGKYRIILYGIFHSYTIQSKQEKEESLLIAIEEDYVKGDKRYKNNWWEKLINLIDVNHDGERDFEEWCELRRQDKRKEKLIKNRIESNLLRPARMLWPLEDSSNKPSTEIDANYNFPTETKDEIDNAADRTLYSLTQLHSCKISSEKVSAIGICQEYLSKSNHHIITGKAGAGKTWLRLYLEYYLLTLTEEKSIPVFYFPPVTLAYHSDKNKIVESLATSIANQLFADLVIQSGYQEPSRDPWLISRAAIVPFLKHFKYDVPSESNCLAQPIPPKQRLSIEIEYNKGYYRKTYNSIKEMIDQSSPIEFPTSSTDTDKVLGKVRHAVELMDCKNVFVIVDNWEYVSNVSRNRLLSQLLEPDLLQILYKHSIFLKLFIPEVNSCSVTYFNKTHEIKRLKLLPNDNYASLPHLEEAIWDHQDTHTLNLYTYC